MNEYKITYTVNGETYSANRVDRTEAAVRRSFLKECKEMGSAPEITGIEFIRDDAIAAKQQERATLEVIKNMVAELGPQSYLATALDGCFADAEQNIEDDAAYSMKSRLEYAEQQLSAAKQEIKNLTAQLDESKKDYDAAHAAAHAIAEEKDEKIAALQKQVLPADDLTDCRQLAESYAAKLRDKVKAAEATILEYAEHPETTTFCDAVKERKALVKDIEYYTALAERIKSIESAS